MDGKAASAGAAPGAALKLDESLALLLLRYLETAGASGAVEFALPRSADVDALLGRLVLDGEDVRGELGVEIARLVRGDPLEPGELPAEWYARTAAAIDHLQALEERLRAYVGAHWREACARFGFTDIEATEPPLEPTPRPAAPRPAAPPVQAAAPERAQQHVPRSYFERRLSEEVSRSVRGMGGFSVVAFEVVPPRRDAAGQQEHLARQALQVIRGGLRPYDVCERSGVARVAALLPGTTNRCCGAVVARVRRALADALGDARVAVGAATWPDHGLNEAALLGVLDAAVACDRRRLDTGEVEIASVPAFMVDQAPARPERRGRLWLDGVGEGLTADVALTPEGLRLRAPLGFLRAGMTVRLGEEGRVLRGRVRGAFLGPSAPGEAPVLQLDIEPASR